MKSIRTTADLAINGAPPAYAEPLHVGRPNIGDRGTFLRLAGEMFDRHWLSNNGPLVREFESRIAARLGVKHCVAMCNGTIALEIAIRALGLTGEVIIPSYTFIATAHALHWQGITPVFADIDPATHNLDPEAVRRMITPRTSGIIGVHLWGRAAPVDALQVVADEHGIQLMFDAAHAFGCSLQGRSIGGFGRAEVLSFHATKCFNTFEGGAVVTDDDALAEAMRLMRNFGFVDFDKVIHPGTNGKMVEVCAAMGLANLESFDETIATNRRNYLAYRAAFAGLPGLAVVSYDESEQNNYHYVVLEVGDECPVGRDAIVAALHAENILARKYFWPGCHQMKPYRDLFPHAGMMLPETQRVAGRVVVLPSGTTLPGDAINVIAAVITRLCGIA
ncbi:aminotransferase class I/II-fold pyridoxal phosphate-dependent enzyme [Luteimonas sp. MC1825]|uniref:DegT/DnrJ/EryC1/StrS family aminotransferase n=1 Tax=Luteimonas sp. MC1825 TaxID=2761107 RepID=UPI00160D5E9F|nr:aminotransferase class I/II-fold pyridoxal phosphate-dependent enzyme [Luteimonas sp. MC1825]MBB6599998.1 aminotransferase class I/II-fold pyridoxal phosphate-dependent enzyme [Luteimonas sp. MC1825]QOC87701.1 aminotransferase class I/II-fold pyridoxal phosphate-dependent enzyme [Luteimonas sp. MC1825]